MIRLEGLSKRFGDNQVLRDVSFEIPEGCLYGLIGPGASGKSVLLKHVAGLMKPDAGRIIVNDRDVTAMTELELQQFRGQFGMLFQNYALFDYLTVGENIAFPLRRLFDLEEAEIRERVAERLRSVSLPGFEDRLCAGLSGGQKKRVGVARATVTRADIVLYDEPASGLDPRARVEIKEILRELARMGKTILISSHILSELRELCTKVGIIEQGSLLFSGPLKEAIARVRKGDVVRVRLREGSEGAAALLAEHEFVSAAALDEEGFVEVRLREQINDYTFVPEFLVTKGYRILELREEDVDLEDAFMKLTRGQVS
ncbi:MAG: ATP-binding cassette domain-containing protein [Myxococcales bacterium]|nr:ATP-binding cassette domain-containing protein [Myxococcales bacterium]